MRQFFIGLVMLVAVVAVGGAVASVAYQAGLSTAITSVAATAPEGTIVTPVAPGVGPFGYGYGAGPGWGWHGGPASGIVGFFVTLFVIFIFFGILRAVFFGGRRGWGGPGGPGGRGGWGHEHTGERPWERQAREVHDAWHRDQASAGSAAANDAPAADRPASGA
jgi:hypothetical protein